MLRFKDRQGREMLYGPTNEELLQTFLDQALNHINLCLKFCIIYNGNLEMK